MKKHVKTLKINEVLISQQKMKLSKKTRQNAKNKQTFDLRGKTRQNAENKQTFELTAKN